MAYLLTLKGTPADARKSLMRRGMEFDRMQEADVSPEFGPLTFVIVPEHYGPDLALWLMDGKIIPGEGYAPGTLLTYTHQGDV